MHDFFNRLEVDDDVVKQQPSLQPKYQINMVRNIFV